MFQLYNTLSRKIELFEPIKNKKVNLFVCGPTVYDFSHLGHARTYIAFDMLARYLKFLGYKVFYLQNITDIDDKIIQRAQEKGVGWQKLAQTYQKEYFADMKSVKAVSVDKYAPATEHIPEIISQVKRLLQKGFAYQTSDGIYYDISKFSDYGKLSGRTAIGAEDGISRIDDSVNKKNKGDFCLWKLSKPDEPSWKSQWGLGRPGWHIEDTAITEKYFGPQYDIHGGGRDLMFPHHEAEISQMEAVSGKKPLVKYWAHTGFLTIGGQKMAKSLGNFITIREFLQKHQAETLRFMVFSSHYRSAVDFDEKIIKEARNNVEKIENFLKKVLSAASQAKSKAADKSFVIDFEQKFYQALEDDFNTPKAKAIMFEFMADMNVKMDDSGLSPCQAQAVYNAFEKINNVFQIIDWRNITKKQKIPKNVLELVKKREELREQKNWKEADEMRQKVKELGYEIEDTKYGPKIKTI